VSEKKPRRLTAKGEATRLRIVAAAADLMYTQGVEATSVDDVIAERASLRFTTTSRTRPSWLRQS
jgi:AcrR family transcriptional regulator